MHGHTSSHRRLLLDLLSVLPDDHDAAVRMARATLGGADTAAWNALVNYAAAHGVVDVIHPCLQACDPPAGTRQELERRVLIGQMWHARLAESLERVARAQAAAGISVCALKGPVLAARLYEPSWTRPSMDIDLLVTPADLGRASDILLSAGYHGDEPITREYNLTHSHHLHFTHPAEPPVELHFRAYVGFGTSVGADALLQRAVPYSLARDIDVLVPDPQDELLYLAVHAAGHSFIRLLWLYDLKLLIRQHPGMNWEGIRRKARSLQLAGPLEAALDLLTRWLGVSIPRVSGAQGVRQRMSRVLLDRVSEPSSPSALDNLGGLVYTALLCDTLPASLGLFTHHTSRTLRRRAHAVAPGLLPRSWGG